MRFPAPKPQMGLLHGYDSSLYKILNILSLSLLFHYTLEVKEKIRIAIQNFKQSAVRAVGLKRLKTYLRSTSGQQRTNDLALLNFHRGIANQIDLALFADNFICFFTNVKFH